MKIGLVGQAFLLSGSLPRAQVELARYLVAAGHEVHVYADPRLRDSSLVSGVVFHDVFSSPQSPGRYRRAWRRFSYVHSADRLLTRRRSEFDVVFARGSVTTVCDIIHFPGVYLGERSRDRAARESTGSLRRVKDRLSPVAYPDGPLRIHLEQRVLETAQRIQVDSRLVRDDLVLYYGVDPRRIEVAPTGVNLDEFYPTDDPESVRRELELPVEAPLILFCGHDFERKGLDRLLAAAARLRERVTVAVVGAGDITKYRELARRLGIVSHVIFVGARADAARYYRAADMVALPTRVDMWGAPVIEAMASGVPPIASEAAGASEAITDGKTGFILHEPVDIDLLVEIIDTLVADPARLREIGRAARVEAESFSWNRVGSRVETAMLAVAGSR